jgi:hypothetical protein
MNGCSGLVSGSHQMFYWPLRASSRTIAFRPQPVSHNPDGSAGPETRLIPKPQDCKRKKYKNTPRGGDMLGALVVYLPSQFIFLAGSRNSADLA